MRVLVSIGLLLLSGVSALACEREDGASAPAAHAFQLGRPSAEPPASSTAFDASAAQEILRLMNQARAQAGLAALVMDGALNAAAQAHGREMLQRGTLSHQLPGEADLMARLRQSGAHFSRAGENVAFDY